jgi:hypothetical protein
MFSLSLPAFAVLPLSSSTSGEWNKHWQRLHDFSRGRIPPARHPVGGPRVVSGIGLMQRNTEYGKSIYEEYSSTYSLVNNNKESIYEEYSSIYFLV